MLAHGKLLPHDFDYILRDRVFFKKAVTNLPPLQLSDWQISRIAESMIEDGVGEGMDARMIDVGFVFLGQHLVHEVLFDLTTHIERSTNTPFDTVRTPFLELDSLYGDQEFYYEKVRKDRLIHNNHDLARTRDGIAIIPERRNDENFIIAQLQLLFIKAHNKIVDRLAAESPELNMMQRFKVARQTLSWHYQWLILNEYLPLLCSAESIRNALESPKFFDAKENFCIPLEFSGAAFRAGHSRVPGKIRINHRTFANTLTELPSFEPARGEYLDWRYLVKMHPNIEPQKARILDTRLAAELHNLPFVNDTRPEFRNLAFLNIKRATTVYGLSSGQAYARCLDVPILSDRELGLPISGVEAPLFYYILKEAFIHTGGELLGPLGSMMVAEPLVGFIKKDPYSYLNIYRDWQPELFSSLAEFVEFAQ